MTSVRLGPFEIHETIGRGGMGVVRRGVYRGPGEEVEVAVKFVYPPEGEDPTKFREAFIREVQSAARLNHPNIVGLFDIGEVDPESAAALELEEHASYLVMEHIAGGTLEDRVGKLQWPVLRDTLLNLLDALAHAHALGIVHRDLKPANVLCSPLEGDDFRPILTDFGIARAMEVEPDEPDEDEPHRVAGTPYYMAPEHVMGRWRDEGPWTDVYALGALAWHLTTGGVPFAGDTGEVLRAHLMSDLPAYAPVVDIPEGFEGWVRRLLHKDLTHRYRRAADAAWALLQLGEIENPTRTTRRFKAVMSPGPTLDTLTASLDMPDIRPRVDSDDDVRKTGLAPPLPGRWQRRDEDESPMLAGAGLGLFGLRQVPVVGREEQRTMLWDGLRRVHETGRPHGVIVSGGAGTGKSRLVEWLAGRAEEVGGAIQFRATHSASSGWTDGLVAMMARFTRSKGLGFESVLMRVRSLYSDLELSGEDALFDGVALTERILGHNPEKATGPRFQSRREWFSALLRLFGGLTRERPILLWLDDVQYSEESLEFARYVLAEEDEDTYPVYVVMTCPVILDTAQRGTDTLTRFRDITSLSNVQQIELGPLTDEETHELVRKMLGLAPELAELVVERTAGNPLFAVQLVEDWVSRGILRLGEDGFEAPQEGVLKLPEDVHATWQHRVDSFRDQFDEQDEVDTLLALAATLGRDVDKREWTAAAAELGAEIPDRFVSRLVGAGLASRHEAGWSFVHGLLRESALLLDEENSAQLHRACAIGIGERWPGPRRSRTAERVAEHWVRAGEPRRAFDELFESVAAHREVEEHAALLRACQRAHSLREAFDLDVDDVRLGQLHRYHATMLRHMGEVDAARAQIDAAWEILAQGRGMREFIGDPDELRNPVMASLLVEEAILVFENETDLVHADELLDAAQQLGRAVDDPVAIGWASRIRSRILCTGGRVDEGVEAARVAVEQYRRIRQTRPDYYFSGLSELAGALRVAGELEEAHRVMARAERWIDDVGSREALALAAMESAELARADGRYADARKHYQTCAELFEILGGKNQQLVALNLCLVDVESGELDRPCSKLEELRRQFPEIGMEGLIAHAELALASCAAASEDWAMFDEYVNAASQRLILHGVRDPELAGLAVIAAREASAHDAARARRALDLATELGGVERHPARNAEYERLVDEL